jgi:excisionase family DNA binding protein
MANICEPRKQFNLNSAPDDVRAYSIPETAALLTISRPSVYKLVREGSLPIVRLNGRTIVPATSIRNLLKTG